MKKKAKRPIKKADLKKPAILDASKFEETALACDFGRTDCFFHSEMIS